MYFDTFERKEMELVVKSMQIQDLFCKMERKRDLRAQIFYFFYFVVVVATAFLFISWITWSLVFLFFVIVLFSQQTTYEQAEKEYYKITKSWWEEIEESKTDMDERQLFLQIIDAFLSGNHEQMRHLAQEAMQSPALVQLKFIQKLQRDMIKK